MFDALTHGMLGTVVLALNFVIGNIPSLHHHRNTEHCNDVVRGFQCEADLSHQWGCYTPWFSVPSEIPRDVPEHCTVTFAQVLSRHGARGPTAHKAVLYKDVISKIQGNVQEYNDDYAFIMKYEYDIIDDELTDFGRQHMVESGIHFFRRYQHLSAASTPFIRVSRRERVIDSAQHWMKGFHKAKTSNQVPDLSHPYPMIVINEGNDSNNTLDHGLCEAYERSLVSETEPSAEAKWAAIFVPPIQARLNANLPGVNLTVEETIYVMDLCPFDTVASPAGTISSFCRLFTVNEWQQYSYYQSLRKYYRFGAGHPLGPTQGVGFTNELIARLTNQPVKDHTSTNRTLDGDQATFPLNRNLYADFSHDNVMVSVLFAMNLFNSTRPLSNTSLETIDESEGYSVAYTVPFAARTYVEKLVCADHEAEEMVRVLVNDRVMPMKTCNSDHLGRCSLSDFIDSLDFAAGGGRWKRCST